LVFLCDTDAREEKQCEECEDWQSVHDGGYLAVLGCLPTGCDGRLRKANKLNEHHLLLLKKLDQTTFQNPLPRTNWFCVNDELGLQALTKLICTNLAQRISLPPAIAMAVWLSGQPIHKSS
jgi:hypothetical protein